MFDGDDLLVTFERRMAVALDAAALEAAALAYLQRYQCSVASLRRVLRRRVWRKAAGTADLPAEEREAALAVGHDLIEAIIQRYLAAGLLNDAAYAKARATSLHRQGKSARGIAANLRAKGLEPSLIAAELEAAASVRPGGDLAAALALARRRRLGPYSRGPRTPFNPKEFATLSRAGFDAATIRRVLDCPDPAAAEMLAREAIEDDAARGF